MLVLLLAKVYVVVMTPLYLCFRFSQPLPLGLAVLNTMAETVLAIEIAAKWHVGEHQDESRKLTARSRIMEFVLFVLYSGSPVWTLQLILENLVFTTRRNRRIARLFAFAPCLKVVQLVHFIYSALQSKAVFKENIANKRVTFDPILFRISKLVAFFLCALHYVGCVYHYVGQIADDEDEVPTSGEGEIDWVYYAANGTREPVLQRWAQAYYWASMAVLGNYMKPKNIVQTTFSTVAVLIGIFTTATITGSVTSLLANADVVAAQQRQKRSRIRNYLRQNRVPELLGQKIHAYYDYLWQSKSLPSDDDLFADLSDTLKLKLALAVKRKFILSCPLFRDLDPYSIVNLVQRLVPKVCEPDQVIMAEGEGGTTMFFVIRGQLAVSIVEAKSKSRIQVAVLKAGDHFGETAIVTPGGKRTATIKALTFCELYMLTKQAFVEAGKSNTKFSRAVRLALHQRDVGRELSKKLRRAKCKLMAFGAFLGAVGSRSDKRKRPPTALLAYHSFSKATTTTRGPRISWRFNLSLSGSDSGSFMRRQLTKSRRRQRVVAPAAAADEEIVPPDDVTSEPSPPPHDEGENDDVVVEPTICSVGSTSKDDDDITETDDETDDISNDERCMTPPLP
ncbi:hypothetical protein CTAYLR_001975 [Chrysophaeum taylorii]|uniref:Cyclic nucleotide-binding domain-containing protein n=1 Tax=Chrysophaeum taylorii TaxID=2483200 RepID=A0AAD7XGA3_9STRA|nr:hypothetical protein CTAYLR_001975 [Chrysophaeum taylorii]